MRVFRLVHSSHDPAEKGEFLARASSHSYQKLADGIYFSLSREDALTFATKPHAHSYSHLLTCDLVGVDEIEVVDLVKHPNLIVKWAGGRYQKRRDAVKAFCRENKKKAILWKAQAAHEDQTWTELCLLSTTVVFSSLLGKRAKVRA